MNDMDALVGQDPTIKDNRSGVEAVEEVAKKMFAAGRKLEKQNDLKNVIDAYRDAGIQLQILNSLMNHYFNQQMSPKMQEIQKYSLSKAVEYRRALQQQQQPSSQQSNNSGQNFFGDEPKQQFNPQYNNQQNHYDGNQQQSNYGNNQQQSNNQYGNQQQSNSLGQQNQQSNAYGNQNQQSNSFSNQQQANSFGNQNQQSNSLGNQNNMANTPPIHQQLASQHMNQQQQSATALALDDNYGPPQFGGFRAYLGQGGYQKRQEQTFDSGPIQKELKNAISSLQFDQFNDARKSIHQALKMLNSAPSQ
eukprot:CAMPEP_0117424816 /NCGR_PEP_ID=MMETSP0758-20121206/5180_1 /TAXON_ID=63605 /ORGANISM="Percolomonas cosmopolitus, Strain AE-1 (ATCC 50343)" /LENGTH=304 /DNA_ID=CAMNT_0005208863 /DNA_START=155 /DNA_END=1069 /DNA_ORIENTATION=-